MPSIFLLVGALFIFQPRGGAQFFAAAQANSPEEFDGYLAVTGETSPPKIISAALEFERHWPHSELIAHVFEIEAEAYRTNGEWKQSIAASEHALAIAPDNLAVLANLAYTIADNPATAEQLARSEGCARKELELSMTIHLPSDISLKEWQETRGHLDAMSHASLGLIAYKRGDPKTAIGELESAIALDHSPDPGQYYRLGVLYRVTGNFAKAKEMLRTATQSGNPAMRRLAEAELKSMAESSK